MTETREFPIRTLMNKVVAVVAVGMAVFHLYTAQFGVFSAMVQRPVHLMFACLLTLLTRPVSEKYKKTIYPWRFYVLDWVLSGLCVWVMLHLASTYKTLAMRGGEATLTRSLVGRGEHPAGPGVHETADGFPAGDHHRLCPSLQPRRALHPRRLGPCAL